MPIRSINEVKALFSERQQLQNRIEHLTGKPETVGSEPTPPPVMLAVKGDGPGDGELFGEDASYSHMRNSDNPRFAFYQLDAALATQARGLLLTRWRDRIAVIEDAMASTHGISLDDVKV